MWPFKKQKPVILNEKEPLTKHGWLEYGKPNNGKVKIDFNEYAKRKEGFTLGEIQGIILNLNEIKKTI